VRSSALGCLVEDESLLMEVVAKEYGQFSMRFGELENLVLGIKTKIQVVSKDAVPDKF
jgi:hypothetical protein